jgi:small subunit ribosomal protein S16
MVKIRLQRVGAKNRPSYRLVVADSRAPRDGAFINIIGHYNPLTDPETVVIDEEKARYWLKQGAQPTDTAARLLAKLGVINKPKTAKKKALTTEDKLETPGEESKTLEEKPKTAKKKAKTPKEKT